MQMYSREFRILYRTQRLEEITGFFVSTLLSAIIHMSNKRFKPDDTVYIGVQPIPWVDSIKILGLKSSNNLTWNSHVAEIRQKTLHKLNVLKCISRPYRGIATRDLLHIAQSAVISALHFGSPLHSLASNSTWEKLEPLLHKALRTATGLPKWTPIPILRRITKVAKLQNFHDLQRQTFIIRQLSFGNWKDVAVGSSFCREQVYLLR